MVETGEAPGFLHPEDTGIPGMATSGLTQKFQAEYRCNWSDDRNDPKRFRANLLIVLNIQKSVVGNPVHASITYSGLSGNLNKMNKITIKPDTRLIQ